MSRTLKVLVLTLLAFFCIGTSAFAAPDGWGPADPTGPPTTTTSTTLDAGAKLSANQASSVISCVAGGAGGAVINKFISIFTFSGSPIPAGLNQMAKYYEGVCFSLVIALIIMRLTITAARDGIDGFMVNAFHTAFGPSLLFAAGMFLIGPATAASTTGTTNFLPSVLVANSVKTGGDIAKGFADNNSYLTAAVPAVITSLNLTGAITNGDISGIMQAGLCSAQGVVVGASPADPDPSDTQGMIQSVAQILGNAFKIALAAVPGVNELLFLTMLAKVIVALYVLWIFARLGFEVMAIYLSKTLLLPVGLLFFAFGQLEIFSGLKGAYIQMVMRYMARALTLALLLPLFVGFFAAAVCIATDASVVPIAGDFVGLFVVLIAAALLDFFLKEYQSLAGQFIQGGDGMSGQQMAGAVAGAMASTMKTLSGEQSQQIQSGMKAIAAAMLGAGAPVGGVGGAGGGSPTGPSSSGEGANSIPAEGEGAVPAPAPPSGNPKNPTGGIGGTPSSTSGSPSSDGEEALPPPTPNPSAPSKPAPPTPTPALTAKKAANAVETAAVFALSAIGQDANGRGRNASPNGGGNNPSSDDGSNPSSGGGGGGGGGDTPSDDGTPPVSPPPSNSKGKKRQRLAPLAGGKQRRYTEQQQDDGSWLEIPTDPNQTALPTPKKPPADDN